MKSIRELCVWLPTTISLVWDGRRTRGPGLAARLSRLGALLAGLALLGCGGDQGNSNNDRADAAVFEICGNGVIDVGEQCDDGVDNSDAAPDACRTNCRHAHCGDGVIDVDEECDRWALLLNSCPDFGYTGGELACTASCTYDASGCTTCGNGVQEGGEDCDGADLGFEDCASVVDEQEGQLACSATCTFDASSCHTCGDGVLNPVAEECEPSDLGGASCEGMGYTFGEIRCTTDTCVYDTTDCFSYCGNGVLERGEQCDGDDLPTLSCGDLSGFFTGGQISCSSGCQVNAALCHRCGNGTLDPDEECDATQLGTETCQTLGGAGTTGQLACNADCRYNASGCSTPAGCGNGVIDPGEQCEPGVLAGQTCATLSSGLYSGGHLACGANCLLDTAGCDKVSPCGNGSAEAFFGEECDGADLLGSTCLSLGYATGTLGCGADCAFDTAACAGGASCGNGVLDANEQCDGAPPPGMICTDLGYVSGTLACTSGCTMDTSGCSNCGDWVRDLGEDCDGADLGGLTCEDVGFSGGSLACAANCSFDVGACDTCGNGLLDGSEQCDGSDFGVATCGSESAFGDGNLSCTASCTIVTANCHECGNWIVESPEVCDNTAGGTSCQDLGYDGGLLGCAADCMGFDESSCRSCGDGLCEVSKGESSSNCAADCGWVQIGIGDRSACGRKADGSIWCWGDNAQGQLGQGNIGGQTSYPLRVSGLPLAAIDLGVGDSHNCAVVTDGTIWCWGNNPYGGLGDGTDQDQPTPRPVPSFPGVVDVEASYQHTCAIRQDSSGWCWGRNSIGQLGEGTTYLEGWVPVQVVGITGLVALHSSTDSASSGHTCALRDTGTVYCWGKGVNGQLGNGIANDASTPQVVSGMTSAASAIASGGRFSCAVKTDGTVWCWGYDSWGSLGNGAASHSNIPSQVQNLSTSAVNVGAGDYHACAVLSDSSLMCWGHNDVGQVGDGSTTDALVAVAVPTLINVTAVTGGGSVSCALTADGEAHCWGYGGYGALGTGDTANTAVPLLVRDLP